jgi:flagellar M-ring protein FliF
MIDQVLLLVRQLTISQRIGIVFGAALTVLMTVGLVMWAGQPQMQAAFTNVATSDAATITSALTSAGIPYTLENGGGTISVPVNKVAEARIAANTAGFTGNSADGYSIFDQQQLGASAFDQQIQQQRATQNNLAGTIKKMGNVAEARVMVVFAKTGITTSSDQPASASVWIQMAGGTQATSTLVEGIVATVANSVPNLSPDNVSVVDSTGKTLSGPGNNAAQALDLQAAVESRIRTNLQTLLDTLLGMDYSNPDKPPTPVAAVQVAAKIDMAKTDQTTTTVKPVTGASDFTPTGWQVSLETYGGSGGAGAAGIPGTTSNVPGLPVYPGNSASPSASPGASTAPGASASPAASPSYVKGSTTVNIANSTDITKTNRQPGTVAEITGAVYVDEAKMTAAGFKDAQALEATLEAAVGAPKGSIPTTAVKSIGGIKTAKADSASPLGSVGDVVPTAVGGAMAAGLLFLVWRNMKALRGRAEEMQLVAARLGVPALASGEMGMTTTADSPLGLPGYHEESLPQIPESPHAKIGEAIRVVAEREPDALKAWIVQQMEEDERAPRRR